MDRQITQPTKEQVRAYMAEREAARRPPPTPEEIRRRLGWRLAPSEDDRRLVQLYLIPSTYGQLAASLALDWFFAPLRRCARIHDGKAHVSSASERR